MFEAVKMAGCGRRFCLAAAVLAAGTAIAGAAPDKPRVGFLCSAPLDHPFWGQVIRVMQAAADDLDVELVVKCDPARSTYATKRLGSKLIDSEPRIDYLLTKYWPSVTDLHMQQAKERGIKVFIFNSDIGEKSRETTGSTPRKKVENWIGHMVPDDRKAGRDLAGLLINRALRAEGNDDKVFVLSLMAPGETSVAAARQQGMKDMIAVTSKAVLQDTVLANWESQSAADIILELLKQHPHTDVIWTANEAIAWGAVRAVERAGKVPGKDILIGGFDWNPESIEAIADGRITASMFGHFMEGAWALLLVHDYHYGFDFADTLGVRVSTPLNVMDAGSYKRYQAILEDADWGDVDFRKLSKKHNPDKNQVCRPRGVSGTIFLPVL